MMPSAGAEQVASQFHGQIHAAMPGIPRLRRRIERTHPPHGRRPPAMPSRPCNPSHQPRRPTPPWHSDAESPPPCTGRVRVPPMQAMAAPRRICSRRRCSRYRLRRSRFAYPSSIIPPFRPSPPITSVAATPGSSPAVPGNVVERHQVIHRNMTPTPAATRRSCTRVIYGYSLLLVRGSSPGAEHSCVAQLAEHPTVNRTVAGSSPAAGATTEKPLEPRGFSHIAATACDRDASSITHAR